MSSEEDGPRMREDGRMDLDCPNAVPMRSYEGTFADFRHGGSAVD